MRTQVAIVGGGPAGLLLGQLLARDGIESVVLERRSRAHVEGRIRAGVLERGLTDMLRDLGLGDRLDRDGIPHDGTLIADEAAAFRVDFARHAGRGVTVFGQTEVTRDLYAAREAAGLATLHGVEDVAIHGADGDAPHVAFRHDGVERRLDCDFVAGCDGFHGVSRRTIPEGARREFEKVYPFGWLGVLSETPPVDHELIYASSPRGFALCSMRSPTLSRHYVQCDADADPAAWSDDAFWDELRRRLPPAHAEALVTGPTLEKSVAALRSFVCEPMRWGRLFLCGDAAHIVPPTGAKGLNAAAADVHYLSEGLHAHYAGDDGPLDAYSARALARVWATVRFSWWFTGLTHRFPGQSGFDRRMQEAELRALRDDPVAQTAMARAYVGLPY